jgi:hypothetical protein
VEGKGEVHSYTEVHHAIQPAFKTHTPYLSLLVELDTQKGEPTPDEALRMIGNLTTSDGKPAPPEQVKQIGVGSRMVLFLRISPRALWLLCPVIQRPLRQRQPVRHIGEHHALTDQRCLRTRTKTARRKGRCWPDRRP